MVDPRAALEQAPMSPIQVAAVATTVALNALDGFDVLAISFAAPGIASDWGLDPAALGVVLSMELVGMAIGSLTIGSAADRFGRRPTVLACLTLMAIGMLLTAATTSMLQLSICRVATGIGIGGMLPALTALVTEHSNGRRRSFFLALMVVGYSAGAVLGGSVAATLLRSGAWQHIFLFGAGVTALFLPIAWFAIPETLHFHIARGDGRALDRANRLLRRLRRDPVTVLPVVDRQTGSPIASLFRGEMRRRTLLCMLVYFGHILTFYFAMKWMSKLLVDAGQHPADAAWLLVLANVAGIAGGAGYGLIGHRIAPKTLAGIVFVASAASVAAFGTLIDGPLLVPVVIAVGIFINSGVVACYGVLARVFPPEIRATGSGLVLGLGRMAAIIAPMLAGQLLNVGLPVAAVTACLALGSLIALAAIVPLRFRADAVASAGTPPIAH